MHFRKLRICLNLLMFLCGLFWKIEALFGLARNHPDPGEVGAAGSERARVGAARPRGCLCRRIRGFSAQGGVCASRGAPSSRPQSAHREVLPQLRRGGTVRHRPQSRVRNAVWDERVCVRRVRV